MRRLWVLIAVLAGIGALWLPALSARASSAMPSNAPAPSATPAAPDAIDLLPPDDDLYAEDNGFAEITGEPIAFPTPAPTMKQVPFAEPPSDTILKQGDSGWEVVLLQRRLRALGFFSYKVSGEFGGYTAEALRQFQTSLGIKPIDGIMGGETAKYLYSNAARRGEGLVRKSPTPTPRVTPKPVYGKLVDWKTAKGFVAWSGGPRFKVRDFRKGYEYYMIRVGGTNHMDVEPANAESTATFKKTYDGRWSYTRRPVLVRFNGTWYAASTNGYPHGKETVPKNNMNGQVCIHFVNSRTHGSDVIDPDHQRCIQIAAGKRK